MPSTLRATEATNPTAADLLHPLDVIDAMIELRIQLQQVERQIASLKPTFFAACLSLNAEKIERTQAVVTRKLTHGKWTSSIDILEQESLVKQLKQHFHQAHEPSHGREVTWAIKLLLNWVR